VINIRDFEPGDQAAARQLILDGRARTGYREIVLETTATWQDIVSFYDRYGFETVGFYDGHHHVRLLL
jgi:hypothetical protein